MLCRAGAIRRFMPAEPTCYAGGAKPSWKRTGLASLRPRPAGRRMDARADLRMAQGWQRAPPAVPRLRDHLCLHLSRPPEEREALALSHRRHKRRRPRRARPSRDTIRDRLSIHDRPKTVDTRVETGHWEGDLIICKRTRPILVLHERKSRVTLAARLTGKTAAEAISVMLAVFGRIKPALRKSITFDNDTVFAQHGLLRTMRNMTNGSATPMPPGKRAASKMPTADYDAGCRATSISIASPTRKSRTSSSPPISHRESASASKHPSRPSSPSLAKTSKSASHETVALRAGIQAEL